MDQALALELFLSGESVLLTGPAGSGKTYILNDFISRARREGKHVSVTATTGLAATHLSGSTIHSWSGIGINDSIPRDFYDNLLKGRRETIKKTDVLIIDEISMLHDFRLDMIEEITRRVREIDEPFGGLQVILCGDFFQLPPVSRGDQPLGEFVVNAQIWEEFDPVICYLDEQHRQDDDDFLDILNAIRADDVRRNHAEKLLSRQGVEFGHLETVTELHTTNVDVDQINAQQLANLDGKEHHFAMATTGKSHYVENLQRSCLALEDLVLKEGALVMCIKNNPEKKYVNGTLGTVVGFDTATDYPIIKLLNGRELTITPETWELRDGDKKRAGLVQIPLRLAWAITVHKSQGMTLDAARIDLRRAFIEGMGYVALSRVRGLDTLSLVGINQMALRVSPQALEIDQQLRKKSAKDAKKFSHLRTRADKRKNEKPVDDYVKSKSEKLNRMREKYPNAYRPWKKSDDEKLVKLFTDSETISIPDLTKTFGRHPGSIRARLIKHFGEDAVA